MYDDGNYVECEKDSCIFTIRKNIKFEFSFQYENSIG